jgi:hypothetical protein
MKHTRGKHNTAHSVRMLGKTTKETLEPEKTYRIIKLASACYY